MKRPLLLCLVTTAIALAIWLGMPQAGDPPAAAGARTEAPSAAPRLDSPGTPTRAPLATASNGRATAVAAVVGRVLDALGQPLPECEVAFLALPDERPFAPAAPAPPVATTRTEADGRFRLQVPIAEPGAVVLRHRDFPPHVAKHGVEVAAGATLDLGEITLFSQPGLQVLVRSSSGGAVGEAVVTAVPALQDIGLPTTIHALRERTAVTDATGQAVLYGVLPGPYIVRVEAATFATHERNHLQPDHPPRAPRLEVTLQPGSVIRGRVLAPPDKDPGRVFLHAEPVSGGVVLRDQMRANGDFRITGALPGRYRVCAESSRLGPASIEVDVPSNTVVTLALGAGLELRGVVRDHATGAPVAGARVVAEPDDGWPLVRAGETVRPEATTDGNGEFTISGLPAGRFAVTASSQWFVPTRLAPVAAGGDPIEIRLQPGLSLTGRVRLDGRPVANARVRAMSWGSEAPAFALWRAALTADADDRSTTTDPDGSFTLAGVPTDGQRLVVVAEGCTLWFSDPLHGGIGQSLDLGTIALRPGASLDGVASAHATVCLQARSAHALSLTATADSRGRFAFHGLPAGEYELFYHSAEGLRTGPASPMLAAERTVVTLDEGERKTIALKH
ncbi:MAG: carboxypeptidase-like regulatory domain-containing protein [Planctomycetota bacterium]